MFPHNTYTEVTLQTTEPRAQLNTFKCFLFPIILCRVQNNDFLLTNIQKSYNFYLKAKAKSYLILLLVRVVKQLNVLQFVL